LIYSLLRKKPPKIINGTNTGADILIATFVDGATAEIKVPNDDATFDVKISIPKQIKNRSTSLFKFDILSLIF
jgi:hypothetical protein